MGATLLLLLSRSEEVRGFRVADTTDEPSDTALAQLDAALRVIECHQPRAFRALKRAITRFVLVRAGGPEYWPSAHAIVLNKHHVEALDASATALTIVHEAVHARLRRHGIGYVPRLRQRIETLCVAAEVQLARTLPNGSMLEAKAVEKLGSAWWSAQAVRERRRRTRDALREDG